MQKEMKIKTITAQLSEYGSEEKSYHVYLERQSDRITNKQQTTILLLF